VDDLKGKPFQHGTGITGAELENLDQDFLGDVKRIDLGWPADEWGNKMSLGNVSMHSIEEMPPGKIEPLSGASEAIDPSVSKAQNRAMHAAAEGRSNLGIPKSVGQEFVAADHGRKVGGLPERKGKK